MKSTERTKVVVRRLPPYLREEELKAEVDKVAQGTYDWFRFYQGKTSTKRVIHSRAYLNFHDSKGVTDFKAKFDGFVFVGGRGSQYKCIVEFAPYQRIPKRKQKTDQRENTLEDDPDFIKFVEDMDRAPVMLPSAQRQYEEEQAQRLASGEGDDDIVVTPLMEFVIQQHFKKTTSRRTNARDRRSDRRREQKSNSPVKSNSYKSRRSPPKVLLKTRPPAKNSDATEKTDKHHSSFKGRSRKPPKIRDGHQAWVPKALRTQGSTGENSAGGKDSITSTTEAPNNIAPKRSDIQSSGDGEIVANGRSRGRRHRGGRGSSSKPSSSSKVVWVPKNEKPVGD